MNIIFYPHARSTLKSNKVQSFITSEVCRDVEDSGSSNSNSTNASSPSFFFFFFNASKNTTKSQPKRKNTQMEARVLWGYI